MGLSGSRSDMSAPFIRTVRSGGEWKKAERIWVRDTSISYGWRPIYGVSVYRSTLPGDPWLRRDNQIYPWAPKATLGEVPSDPTKFPTISLLSYKSGGAIYYLRFTAYKYDESGANPQQVAEWVISTTIEAGPLIDPFGEVPYVVDPNTWIAAEPRTKYAINIRGSSLASGETVVRWQTGGPATYVQVPRHGWGPLSGWQDVNTHFTPSMSHESWSNFHAANAWDAAGVSTAYESGEVGQIVNIDYGLIKELIGDGWRHGSSGVSFQPTINLTWKAGATARVDEIKVDHRGMIGLVYPAVAVVSRGQIRFRLEEGTTPIAGTNKATTCSGDHAGPEKHTLGTTTWQNLNWSRTPGKVYRIRATNLPYFGKFAGSPFARFSVADMRIRSRNWEVVGYDEVEVLPAVSGSTW